MATLLLDLARETAGGRVITVLEGGYNLEVLEECTEDHVRFCWGILNAKLLIPGFSPLRKSLHCVGFCGSGATGLILDSEGSSLAASLTRMTATAFRPTCRLSRAGNFNRLLMQ